MSALSVTLNEQPIVSVASDELDLIEVVVRGDRLGPGLAVLRVSGGRFADDSERGFLIWVNERELTSNDLLRVEYQVSGTTSARGKTIEELYPEEFTDDPPAYRDVNVMFRELAQRPKLFERLSLRLTAPGDLVTTASTGPTEHGFGFSVSWASHRPGYARVSLHTYTLQSLIDNEPATYHAKLRLNEGEGVSFRVDA